MNEYLLEPSVVTLQSNKFEPVPLKIDIENLLKTAGVQDIVARPAPPTPPDVEPTAEAEAPPPPQPPAVPTTPAPLE